jgi:hypothetical protein
MLSIRHITTAGVLTLALAAPATGSAQVLRGHDLHAAGTSGTTVNSTPVASPAAGFDWEDAGIGAIGALGLVVAVGAFTLIGRDRPQSATLPEHRGGR